MSFNNTYTINYHKIDYNKLIFKSLKWTDDVIFQ